ncbi:MAG TPA: GNAT family N-acetyltransferase [Dehalococcoidia bacterium]|jgi:amino-acid N-acetyltransferase|nr:GNAT family N-acetyltransferase [Dehalococcoidia bacterium]
MTMQLEAITNSFIPGAYWTPERAQRAVAAMNARLDTPEVQAMLEHAGDDFNDTHTGELQQPSLSPTLSRDGVRLRRARRGDLPAITDVIVNANLPALFVEEFAEGFAVAEQDGAIIATGGLEIYENAGFLRSIAVTREGRGLGLGREITKLLIADARAARIRDMYLFTQDAVRFWQHMGFADVPMDAWPESARANWQYRYINAHFELMQAMGTHSMWKAI